MQDFSHQQFAPENGWLEYDRFLLGFGLFAGAFAVSFREGSGTRTFWNFLSSTFFGGIKANDDAWSPTFSYQKKDQNGQSGQGVKMYEDLSILSEHTGYPAISC